MPKPIPPTREVSTCYTIGADGVLELRAADPLPDQPGFDGYVTTWWTVDDRGTAFAPGSFKKTLRERTAIAPILWQHNAWTDNVPIGRHLSAKEDGTGVRISAAINEDIQLGAEVMSALRFGTPIGLSFGFDRVADRTAEKDDPIDLSVAPSWVKGLPREEIRIVTETRYWEASPVVFGANAKARPDNIRSLSLLLDAIRGDDLSDEDRALAEQIVAAMSQRAAAGPVGHHGTRQPQARRDYAREFAFLAVELGIAPEVAA